MEANGGFAHVLEVGARSGSTSFPVTLFLDPKGYLYCIATWSAALAGINSAIGSNGFSPHHPAFGNPAFASTPSLR
jgi:hypothetical protein